MTDLIILLALAGILTGAGLYVYRAKKNGQKCIGCPNAKSCAGPCACSGKKRP